MIGRGIWAGLILALALVVGLSPSPGLAKVYTEAELSAFNIADVKLDMAADEAAKKLTARGYSLESKDPNPTTATWRGPNGAVVTLQFSAAKRVAAIGLFSPLPDSTTMDVINKTVVPSLIDRFGEPTKTEPAGQVVVMAYLTANPAAGATAMTLRISRAGIDGRLGR
jgi:hypothetical protein